MHHAPGARTCCRRCRVGRPLIPAQSWGSTSRSVRPALPVAAVGLPAVRPAAALRMPRVPSHGDADACCRARGSRRAHRRARAGPSGPQCSSGGQTVRADRFPDLGRKFLREPGVERDGEARVAIGCAAQAAAGPLDQFRAAAGPDRGRGCAAADAGDLADEQGGGYPEPVAPLPGLALAGRDEEQAIRATPLRVSTSAPGRTRRCPRRMSRRQ